MNQISKTRLLASISLLAILVTTVFAAYPVQAAQASVRTVQLTIDNRATSAISLTLSGPYQYSMSVAGGTTQSFTVNRGTYTYTLKGCGMTVKDEFELKQNTILINPVCGGKVRTIPADRSKIDLSNAIRVVPVTIESELTYKAIVILTGPSTYVFTLKPGQELDVTIGKGLYDVRYFACGVNVKRQFQAYKNAVLKIYCP
jgi:hypothetical protein